MPDVLHLDIDAARHSARRLLGGGGRREIVVGSRHHHDRAATRVDLGKLVAQVVALYFPDFRRVLNELQRFSSGGELSEAILSQITDKDINDLFDALKSQDFQVVRKWIGVHDDMDSAAFYRMLYDYIPKKVDDSCVAEMIVTMADYSYKAGFCADPQLNNLACLVEILHNAKWK